MKIEKNNLRLIVMDNFLEFGKKVDEHLKKMYRITDDDFTFIVPIRLSRFASGRQKLKYWKAFVQKMSLF